MEDLILEQYNRQLAQNAADTYNQNQRMQNVNAAAMDVIQQGFQNQQGLQTLPGSDMSLNMGMLNAPTQGIGPQVFQDGMVYAPDDPRIMEMSNYNEPPKKQIPDTLKRMGISLGAKALGLPAIVGTGLGLAFAPIAGIANLFGGVNDKIQGSLFGRSANLAAYMQAKRDQKARDNAARRGDIKRVQADINSGKYDTNKGSYTSKDTARENYGASTTGSGQTRSASRRGFDSAERGAALHR